MTRNQRDRQVERAKGFTLVEIIVGVAVISVLLALGAPMAMKTIHTAKVSSVGFDSNVMVRRAKSEAIKKNSPVVVRADLTTNELVAFVDVHGLNPDADPPDPPDGLFNPRNDGRPYTTTDHELQRMPLPAGVTFLGPPADAAVIDGFTAVGPPPEVVAIVETDGSVRAVGGFRIGDARGNYLQIRVEPLATAKVTLLKWNRDLSALPLPQPWKAQGEDGVRWVWY